MTDLNCLDHRAETLVKASFWDTPAGITRSIKGLGEYFTYDTYNNATHILGETYGVSYLIWTLGIPHDKACPRCVENSQKGDNGRFKVGWFIPQMPVHPHCRCTFKLEVKLESKPAQ